MKNNNSFESVSYLNDLVITSEEFMNAYTGIQQCAERSIAYKEPIGSMLLSEGGLGKTTLCHAVIAQMPNSIKIENDRQKIIIPAFYVEVPSPATVKSLAITMLNKLGDPSYDIGTTKYLTSRLTYLLIQCETKLVFLDEFHHLFDRKPTSTRMNITVGNWIKTLVNETGISFCLVGLSQFADLIQVDTQIARRFPFHYKLSPLTLGTKDICGTIYSFLHEIANKALQHNTHFSPELDSYLLGMQIYAATKGYHSYVMSLVRESMMIASEDGRTTVTQNDFSQAWALGITLFISDFKQDPFAMSLSQLASNIREI
ncbi:TniB family NTP-binding protein [Acinetobacter nosocomialis]|uniref:TniB family NTP-binding protein n=1 Tax=Acinetobacter nosocomialis TaxID=106654 RepID=UPI0027415050|nr:TniB family NTP-binding protein [Acinetobacter nosocomialis]MDP7773559.1 TniB family NTP-binding protein [Acinetobacter nosocomialis]